MDINDTEDSKNSSQSNDNLKTSTCSGLNISIHEKIGNFFFWYGKLIATNPLPAIIFCCLVTALCSFGLIGLSKSKGPYEIWIPKNSDFNHARKWKSDHFQQKQKKHIGLVEAENILTRNALLEILDLHEAVANTKVLVSDLVSSNGSIPSSSPRNVSWEDICTKVPALPNIFKRRRKRFSVDISRREDVPFHEHFEHHSTPYGIEEFIPSTKFGQPTASRKRRQASWFSYLSSNIYCGLIKLSKKQCYERSILEIWGYDRDTIAGLTDEEIIEDLNSADTSAVFGIKTNFSSMLSGIERDESGRIVKAKITILIWATNIQFDRIIPGKFINIFDSEYDTDVDTFRWQEQTVQNVEEQSKVFNYSKVHTRFSEELGKVTLVSQDEDLNLFYVGYAVVFVYIQLILGKFHAIEARPILSVCGFASVFMSVIISFGVCGFLGFKDSEVNNVLPVLLLALGIDDMFVIMRAFNNLSNKESEEALTNRIGTAMRRAGASILVTSVTDMIAFGIGSFTSIPGLRTFCIIASTGIGIVFFFQITFFVACLTFDQKRIEAKRHFILFCWKKERSQPYGREDCGKSFFGWIYPRVILTPVAKKLVLFVSLTVFAVSCWGVSRLEQKFEVEWFIPMNAKFRGFVDNFIKYFPDVIEVGEIFVSNTSLHENLHNIEYIVDELETHKGIAQVSSWFSQFKRYHHMQGYDTPLYNLTESIFSEELSSFLFSAEGLEYQKDFVFENILTCGDPAPKIETSRINFQYKMIETTKEKLSVLNFVKSVCKKANMTEVIPYALIHSAWENDAIIAGELVTNLSLAVLVIFTIVFVFLSSFLQSLLVVCGVLMTLVDVGGLIHFWGLTINCATSVCMIVGVGLSVDYSAHVGKVIIRAVTQVYFCSNALIFLDLIYD